MTKEERYQKLLTQAESLISSSDHWLSNFSNLTALIHNEFNFHWTGFYLVDPSKNELYLGPFQGPLACTKIPYGKGVCGTSYKLKKAIVVADVHQFDGHIACSSQTNSEIVIPLIKPNGEVHSVLDIDSIAFNDFGDFDKNYLEKIVQVLVNSMNLS